MNKQDWIEYFEALNGRTPSAEELAQALANGEFAEEVVAQAAPVQEPVAPQPQPQVEQVQQQAQQQATAQQAQPHFTQQVQQGFAQVQQNQQVQDFKVKGKNYLNWFIGALKNPIPVAEVSQFNYGLMTLILSSLFMSGALVNYFRRIFTSIANASVAGESLKANQPEIYDRLISSISQNLGLGKLVYLSVIFFVLYAFITFLPTLISRLSGNGNRDWKEEFGRCSQFMPLLMVVNLVALLASFLVKNQLIISKDYIYQISNIGYYFEDNALSVLPTLAKLIKEVPAVKSISDVSLYIGLASVVGFLVLFVACIKNIKVSYKKFNEFYVSLLAFLLVLGAVYFADKMIIKVFVETFMNLFERITDFV